MKIKLFKKFVLGFFSIVGLFVFAGLLNLSSKDDEFFCMELNSSVYDSKNDISPRISPSTGYTISRNFAYYNYNPNGICGSVASANFLQYYDDYYDDCIISEENEYNEIGILTILTGMIEGVTDFETTTGSTLSKVVNGVNEYLELRSSSYRVTYNTYDAGALCQMIKRNAPVILMLSNHPVYGNHWVVATGYYKEMGSLCTVYLVDGWYETQKSITELSTIKDMIYMEG